MRLWILILLAVVSGLSFGLGLTILELGPAPVGAVALAFGPPLVVDPNGPIAAIDKEEFDFGAMERDSHKSHTFTIRNDGKATLVLSKGESTCRCTKFEIAKKELAPGEETRVDIEWQANVLPGQFRQSATINTNDPAKPQIALTIAGKVTTSHRIAPDNLVFTGISVNEPHTAEARIYSYQPGQLEVLSQELSNSASADQFDIRVKPLSADELKEEPDAKSGVVVAVTVKPGLPLGPFRHKIQLRLNLTGEPVVELPIEGNVVSDLIVVGRGRGWDSDRELLSMGTVSSLEGAKAELFILAHGPHRQDVHPKLQQANPDFLKVTIGEPAEIAGGAQVRVPLTIEIPKGSRPGIHLGGSEGKLGEILIDTGHPEAKTLRIPVRFAIGQ